MMNLLMFGESFFKLSLANHGGGKNSTEIAQATVKWSIYQYGMCSLFVISGCLVLCPLLQKRNYKSKKRKRILMVDGMMLLLCLTRTIALLFSSNQTPIAAGCMIFLWSFGSTLLITSLTVFLFILRSTTRLEIMIWRFKNTMAVASILVSNLVDIIFQEVIMFHSISGDARNWMINFLLILNFLNGFFYFVLGLYFCGTFRRMNQNREPSIRLVKETSASTYSQSKVVHTDAKNFHSMVQKLRLLALLTFLRFAVGFYISIKLLIVFNATEDFQISDWEIWGVETSTKATELMMIIVVFCVGFFSAQHKEAARQWIRGLSITRSHDDLTARRTMSLESGRDTVSEERSRAGTLTVDIALSDYSNETVTSSIDAVPSEAQKTSNVHPPKIINVKPAQKVSNAHPPLKASNAHLPKIINVHPPKKTSYVSSDSETKALIKQNANYLMVPRSFPLIIETDFGELKDNIKNNKQRIFLEVVDENIE